MRVIIGMGHPAHFHLFKNIIDNLILNKIDYLIVFQQKDILENLLELSGYNCTKILSRNKDNLIKKLIKYLKSLLLLNKIVKRFSPNIMIGSISQLAHIGYLRGIDSYFTAEDDFRYTWIQGIITYPFITKILAPTPTDVGPFKYKKEGYEGYHKLAYLHPEYFIPNNKLIDRPTVGNKFILIRLVSLDAYHDLNKKGLSINDLRVLIPFLENYGRVFITSESELPNEFKQYTLKINPLHIHHYLYFADLFIGDSQTMAIEASLLGTPSVRINSFYNKINVIHELELKYQLTFSFPPNSINYVLEKLKIILETPKNIFQERKQKLLADKIDTTKFLFDYITNSYNY